MRTAEASRPSVHSAFNPHVIEALSAAVLTAVVGTILAITQARYQEHRSYFFDPVYYSFENARLFVRQQEDGPLAVARSEWVGNSRDPLRTVPLLLAPGLLAHPEGHLATALPALAAFLFVLGHTVRAGGSTWWYVLAAMTAFAFLPGMFHPIHGLGPYWLDLPAALLLGAGGLCLLSSSGGRDWRWLAASATLLSAGALSRYVAAAFAAVTCGPLLAGIAFLAWRRERTAIAALRPVALMAAIVALTAGPYLVRHFAVNTRYYAAFGYALGGPVSTSAAATLGSMGAFLTVPVLAGLLGLSALNGASRDSLVPRSPLLWLAAAPFLFLVLVLRSGAHAQAALYSVPPLFALAVIPADRRSTSHGRRSAALAILAIIVFAGCRQAWGSYLLAGRQSGEKAFDVALARKLDGQGGRLVWQTFFDEYAWIPSLEAFHRFGRLPLPAGQSRFFTVHESVWKGAYPDRTPMEIGGIVYDRTCRWVHLVVVCAETERIKARFNNVYSLEVARFVSESIRRDDRWEPVFRLRNTPYGEIIGYRNRAAVDHRGYDLLLKGLQLD